MKTWSIAALAAAAVLLATRKASAAASFTVPEKARDALAGNTAELIAQAAQLGGEALILGPESTDSEFIFTGTAMIKSDKRNLTGEVIVYDRASAAS